MKFFNNAQNSIYSPEFYSTVSKKPLKNSLGYFLLLILLLTVIRLITLIHPVLITAPVLLQDFVQNLTNCFPKDLEIKINSGKTSINAEEPYFISCQTLGSSQNLVVIDTKTPYSATKFAEYNTGVWVTKDSVAYKKNNYETRSYGFDKVKDFKLNKQSINSYYNTVSVWFKFVGPILLLLSFIGIYLSYNFRLIYLFFFAALLWLLSKIFKHALSFSQSYKTGLYALTLGLIVELAVNLTSRWTNFHGFPFMVTILTLSVVIVNLFTPRQNA